MTNTETPAAVAPAAAKPARKAAAKPAAPKTFMLATRARELGVNPKSARAAFRRLFATKSPGIKRVNDDAWEFPTSERAKVDARLKAIAAE